MRADLRASRSRQPRRPPASRVAGPSATTVLAWSQFVATASSMGSTTAVAIVMVGSGLGSWMIAAVLLAGALPSLIVAPIAAPMLDGRRLGRLVMWSGLAEAAILVATAVHPTVPILIGMVAAVAIVGAVSSPALLILAQHHNAGAARSFARMDSARVLGLLIGPTVGGVLMQFSTIHLVLVIDAGGAVLLATAAARYPGRASPLAPTPTWWARVTEAPTLLWRDRRARGAMTGLCAAIVCTSVYSVAEALYALNVLDLPALGYALLGQCFVVGRLAGSRIAARLTTGRAGHWLVYAGSAMGVGLAVPGLVPNPWVAAVFFGAAGTANAVQVAAIRLVVIDAVPETAQARALSTMGSVNTAAMLVGFALGAPVVAWTSASSGLVVAGCGTVIAVLAGAAASARTQNRSHRGNRRQALPVAPR